MKKVRFLLAAVLMMASVAAMAQPKVYFTKEITQESLVKIYKALGVEATGRVAVKISTGEGGNTYHRGMLYRLSWHAYGSQKALGNNPRTWL